MSFLLLFSTLSFTVDMHFCGHALVDFGIYHEAEGCGMSMDDDLMVAFGCCDDVEWTVDGQDELQTASSQSQPAPAAMALLAPQALFCFEPLAFRTRLAPYSEYAPPRLVPDRTVRYQRFLI